MKCTLMTMVALAILLGTASAQYVESGRYTTATLVDLDSIYIYIVRNSAGVVDIDSVLTTYSDVAAARTVPPTGLMIEPEAGSGMVSGETDSLLIKVWPMVYDWAEGVYETSAAQTYYLDFVNQKLTLTRTALNWNDGYHYYVPLVDANGRYLFESASGVRLQIVQRNATGGNGAYTIQPMWRLDNK